MHVHLFTSTQPRRPPRVAESSSSEPTRPLLAIPADIKIYAQTPAKPLVAPNVHAHLGLLTIYSCALFLIDFLSNSSFCCEPAACHHKPGLEPTVAVIMSKADRPVNTDRNSNNYNDVHFMV
jgi:hypothetical protein